MSRKPASPRRQYAALPWRKAEGGGIEVLLITSRETRRWVVPKGWPIAGLEPGPSAAQEAMEEAGIVGEVWGEPVGEFGYDKRLKDGRLQPVQVEVFPLLVEKELADWPEKGQREKRWFPAAKAAELVHEPQLAALIEDFAGRA
ncbi:MAG TPA: NUDIX hydrolase [Phenylobacterium sp.]